ncbi:small heat shock protein [Thermothelomyces heterothallicus CBS 202.75]|uniref:small heat shock protein n=1 Tax=Thermothelomyces heterothallicus CBS 202.75 TaxID=1149848 RepID=UPI003743E3DA
MAFFTDTVYSPNRSFTPLFRLLDEFDNYTREVHGTTNERFRPRGRRQAGAFQPKFDARETDSAFELYGELPGIERDKISVEFTEPQTMVIRGRTERAYPSPSARQPADTSGAESSEEGAGDDNSKAASDRYWLQERTVGDFARVFNFPTRIDQNAVSARLHNGILSVVVPKARRHEARRIAIN